MSLLRSRKTFVALALLAFPPVSWAFAIFLHDDLRLIWQNEVLFVAIYFGVPAALVVALGSLTERTRTEIAAVVLATGGACIVFGFAMVVWAISTTDFN
jgi:hypothetical protein